jgi:prevent-host-death family protein
MKTVSARQANHAFSQLLARVERGEKILITKRSKPVALLSPYRPPRLTPERKAAIEHAIEVMAQGLLARQSEKSQDFASGHIRGAMSATISSSSAPTGLYSAITA